jgi:hypothetical protein
MCMDKAVHNSSENCSRLSFFRGYLCKSGVPNVFSPLSGFRQMVHDKDVNDSCLILAPHMHAADKSIAVGDGNHRNKSIYFKKKWIT